MGKKSGKIKQIIEDFEKKFSNKTALIRPVFAHASQSPVKSREAVTSPISPLLAGLSYHYIVTSFINEDDLHEINILIDVVGNENPPVFEQYTLDPSQSEEIVNYLTIPSRIFDLDNEHKMVVSFHDVEWSREYFNKYINVWTKGFQILN